jgi:hypothetical protein
MCTSNIQVEPFLDTLGTVGSLPSEPEVGIIGKLATKSPRLRNPSKKGEFDRVTYNRQRCFRMVTGKKEANQFREDIHEYIDYNADKLTPAQVEALFDYRCALSSCCQTSLFREHQSNGATEFIAAFTCGHKLCPICNAQRSKNLRRKFREFFAKNPDLIERYDFMHLTLTVPHEEEGGRFQGFYASELMKAFNLMRKRRFWKKWVWAGEFSVEVTKNEAGLHIHLHSLLLVEKGTQNRNKLHREILLAWNKITTGASSRTELTTEEAHSIQKGNKLLTDQDIARIDPSGATFIGLDTLFISSKTKRRGYQYCEHSGLWKKRVHPKDGDLFLSGILECLKYHFEPLALKQDGSLDVKLAVEILPAIKGQPLYRKFGAFHSGTKNAHPDAKMLNVKSKPDEDEEDIKQTLEEIGQDIENPETGEVADRSEYEYFTVSMSRVFVNPDDNYRISITTPRRKRYLHRMIAPTALSAIKFMQEHGAKSAWRKKSIDRMLGRAGHGEIILPNFKN